MTVYNLAVTSIVSQRQTLLMKYYACRISQVDLLQIKHGQAIRCPKHSFGVNVKTSHFLICAPNDPMLADA